jgi:hypothetical protein
MLIFRTSVGRASDAQSIRTRASPLCRYLKSNVRKEL